VPWPPSLESGLSRACPLAPPPPHGASRYPARTSSPIVRAPLSTPGSAQTPCPPPTSCLSVARGWAPRPFTRPSPPLAMVARAGLREAAPVAEMAALKIGCVCAQRAGHTGTHADEGGIFASGRSGRGRCGSANGGARAARIRTKAGLGVEATIAPNTTSSLAAEGGNLDRAREAGLYSLKACIARL
jgi:hypothetical protein